MKKRPLTWMLLFLLSLSACKETPSQPHPSNSSIIAYVHWGSLALSQKQIVLVETADTLYTDSSGHATFSVAPGHYTVRAFGINRIGPSYRYVDFGIDVHASDTVTVDIVDCLPCV